MTSVRPKLKPDTPKAITAWDTATGATVWMTNSGDWSNTVDTVGVFVGEEAEQQLRKATENEVRVTDPYFMEVSSDGKIIGRERLRESIRAYGPTSHPEFSKRGGL